MHARDTAAVRRVLGAAQTEAAVLGHNTVEPEHLLVGLLASPGGAAAAVLAAAGASEEAARQLLVRRRPPVNRSVTSPPMSSRAKEAVQEANRERSRLGDAELGTAHLLLGLLSPRTGGALDVLADMGIEPAALRDDLLARRPWPVEGGGPSQRTALLNQQPSAGLHQQPSAGKSAADAGLAAAADAGGDRATAGVIDRSQVPYRFELSATAADVVARHADLGAGEHSGEIVSVAGRLMLRRELGKVTFGALRDSSGQIQLFAGAKWTADFDDFSRLSLGDWIGATGEVVRTRTGELSVEVSSWVLLAEARRSFGDKWRGIADVDLRYRQRYADLWANEGSREILLLRSRVVSLTRRWLEDRGFVEVETPIFHPVPGGALARPFVTHHNALNLDLYLRIAPELYLKRLVVGGFEKVFEIGRVFRNEGLSPRHNPEFTMLELYQAYADYGDMMVLVEGLVAHLAVTLLGTTSIVYGGRELDLTPPWRRATMSELVAEHTGLDISVATAPDELRALCAARGIHVEDAWGPGKLLLEVYEKTTEAYLWGPVFVMDYPKEVSPLARDHRSAPGLVERFEPVVAGRELGNAFSELVDPDEQRARFQAQVRARAAGDGEAMGVDEDYLRAMEYGLPPTGGLGIGMDRLVMLLSGAEAIRDVIAFPTMRPETGLT
ncbi:MAG TPA: lysine--tRNA ligase [Acidimicrobiales bacterium]|nr:lysine--tRNA ligase [Acidimicrobiales bacterium]